jgi:hypothetical protein
LRGPTVPYIVSAVNLYSNKTRKRLGGEKSGVINNAIDQQGFHVVPDVLSPTEARSIISSLNQSEMRRSRAGIRHVLRHPRVATLARDPRLAGIARSVLGSGAVPFRATLLDKSPQANWLVVWHQDTALPLRRRLDISGWGSWSEKDGVIYAHAPASALKGVLALRVHLDESSLLNGPLRVLPGTHIDGVLSDDEIQRFALEIAPIDCVVPEGGVLAMRPLLIHASSKSTSEDPRRVLHIEYAASVALEAGLELAIT